MASCVSLMDARPSIQRMLVEREAALSAFMALNVKYDGQTVGSMGRRRPAATEPTAGHPVKTGHRGPF